jgi:hypothetical protein
MSSKRRGYLSGYHLQAARPGLGGPHHCGRVVRSSASPISEQSLLLVNSDGVLCAPHLCTGADMVGDALCFADSLAVGTHVSTVSISGKHLGDLGRRRGRSSRVCSLLELF